MSYDTGNEIVEALSTCEIDDLPSVLADMTARYSYEEVAEFAEKAKGLVPLFPEHEGPVRTIAMFYFRMNNGGIEHEMALLANLLVSMGYRVVVVVDVESPDDYPLDARVVKERLMFPTGVSRREEKLGRFQDLLRIMRQYDVDLFVNHAWLTPDLVFDVILSRLCGVRCVMNAHGVFGYMLVMSYYDRTVFNSIPRTLRFYESAVVQTEMSSIFFGQFCPRTYVILNCVDYDQCGSLSRKPVLDSEKPTILWLGRFDDGKRPEDALEILTNVRNGEGVDARLVFVGKSEDGCYERDLEQRADCLGVRDSVDFVGFRTDVETFYSQADVLLMTTELEGFCMVLLEASAAGLPTVMYRLPYLPFDASEGIANVDMRDTAAAAREIAAIVRDPERWERMSQGARACYEEFLAYDYESAWREVIEGRGGREASPGESEQLMWDTLLQHYALGRERVQQRWGRDVERAWEEGREQGRERGRDEVRDEYEQSGSYRVGRALTALPRRLRGGKS